MKIRLVLFPFTGAFAIAAGLAVVGPVSAASPDAWETFRAEVEAACVEAAAELIETPAAVVDPFGSQSYGLALVQGKAKGAESEIRAICVFDKQTKAVELGGELPEIEDGAEAGTDTPAEETDAPAE